MHHLDCPGRRRSTFFTAALVMAAGGMLLAACGISNNAEDVFQESSQGAGASPTGTGGGGTGGGGTGGGSTGAENCTDGADNDGDGMTDCADPDCQPGFECVAAAPSGWDGYFLVHQGPYPDQVPSCADGTTPETYFAGPAGPAECSACSCGPLEGAACDPPPVSCWSGSTTCNGQGQDWTAQVADGQCDKPALGGVTIQLSCALTGPAPVAAAGACEPSITDFPNKDTWQQTVVACGGAPGGGGCGEGEACAPKPEPNQENVCIRHDGQNACPAGWSTVVQAYAGGTDTRGCEACSCEANGTTCTGGLYVFYDDNQCMGGTDPPRPIDSTSCTDVSQLLDFGSWGIQATLPQAGGACGVSGGQPTGEMQTDGPVTFCCR